MISAIILAAAVAAPVPIPPAAIMQMAPTPRSIVTIANDSDAQIYVRFDEASRPHSVSARPGAAPTTLVPADCGNGALGVMRVRSPGPSGSIEQCFIAKPRKR